MNQDKTRLIKGIEISTFFNSILKGSDTACILVLDHNGVILEISRGLQKTFGYTEEDLKGVNFDILFSDENRAEGLPVKELQKAKKSGSATDINYLVLKNGNKIWCHVESMAISKIDGEDLFVKLVYDLNQQKLLEQSLQASRKFAEGVLETINEALLVLDKDFKIVSNNAAFKESFNIDEDLSGQSFFEISNKSWDVSR